VRSVVAELDATDETLLAALYEKLQLGEGEVLRRALHELALRELMEVVRKRDGER